MVARASVQQIARSRTGLTEEQISSMSPAELWDVIYASQPPKQPQDQRETYFPTGFTGPQKTELNEEAERRNFRRTSDVNSLTDIVVTGNNPGRGRLEKASIHCCKIMTHAQFLAYARHGVVDVSDREAQGLIRDG